jgi:hypothetical protein
VTSCDRHVAGPSHHANDRILVDVGAIAADHLEVPARVRTVEDVVIVDEIHRVGRDLAVLAAVEDHVHFLAGAEILQRGKAAAGLVIAVVMRWIACKRVR